MLAVVLSFGALYAFIPIIIIIILIAAAAGLSRGWDLFTLFGFAVITDFARGAGRGAVGKGLNTSKYTAGAAASARFRARVPSTLKFGGAPAAAAALGGGLGRTRGRYKDYKKAKVDAATAAAKADAAAYLATGQLPLGPGGANTKKTLSELRDYYLGNTSKSAARILGLGGIAFTLAVAKRRWNAYVKPSAARLAEKAGHGGNWTDDAKEAGKAAKKELEEHKNMVHDRDEIARNRVMKAAARLGYSEAEQKEMGKKIYEYDKDEEGNPIPATARQVKTMMESGEIPAVSRTYSGHFERYGQLKPRHVRSITDNQVNKIVELASNDPDKMNTVKQFMEEAQTKKWFTAKPLTNEEKQLKEKLGYINSRLEGNTLNGALEEGAKKYLENKKANTEDEMYIRHRVKMLDNRDGKKLLKLIKE